VVSNPEFLAEGSAVSDAMNPERIVIGAPNRQVAMKLIELYSILEKPMIITSVRSAEMIKYASNAFLATKITFINEVAEICERLGADVHHVAKGMGLDGRIGPKFLHPGPGYGGSCFPKDTKAITDIGRQAGCPFEIVETVVKVNDRIKLRMVEKIRAACGGSVEGLTIGVLGLAFKPETDDMRDAAAIPILHGLVKEGARIRAYDPAAMENAKEMLPASVVYCSEAYDVAQGCDCLLILTEWNQFRSLDLERLRSVLRRPLVVDLRNVYEPGKMREAGFEYESVGRAAKEIAL
jgi:UDPglucose 6-dehydrogenase